MNLDPQSTLKYYGITVVCWLVFLLPGLVHSLRGHDLKE